MVIAQIGFRGWALAESFFFTDDYRLIRDAEGVGLSWSYLLAPFDSQFMPAGRLAVWLVAHNGTTNWPLAATMTTAVQALAGAACVWMLVTLFGARRAILAPLGIYLTSALTLPGFMWWAAALNQLPMQLAFFLAVGSWVRYVRHHSGWSLAATTGSLALGLACYPKSILIVPVLAWLLLAYFVEGGAVERLLNGARSHLTATILGVAAAGGYAVWYVLSVPQPFEPAASGSPAGRAAEVADAMLGTSLSTGAVGGPWTWFDTSPPIVLAQPPGWTVPVAWSAIVLGAAYVALRRERTGARLGPCRRVRPDRPTSCSRPRAASSSDAWPARSFATSPTSFR